MTIKVAPRKGEKAPTYRHHHYRLLLIHDLIKRDTNLPNGALVTYTISTHTHSHISTKIESHLAGMASLCCCVNASHDNNYGFNFAVILPVTVYYYSRIFLCVCACVRRALRICITFKAIKNFN